ncbi:IroE protein [Campylobacter hyointestinalis]|uniref:alpha/beta hydrolase n=1 Tax=Campylobacter hyointestinalis TaxID=198 RepID=UPI0004D80C20|nr:alpha/beta hydrolase-fold protein [Campylobacter hyointestinalis]ANE33294.1 alpha/beta hydrolase family protein [Campylobacter hyointestinalis subsp. hyointestinalis LMG 9260]KEA44650.1 hypothetical protein CR67_02410 [Campylobacter hyointestinalis subsp. hyointestinalis]QKF56463.1 alpha/beta hydrolase family protein [Campylobacter hyointestinalis subsp. hyointestinalis]SFT42537.1 hypothetical protein SAMN05421691_0580 [Campylobacter hyointestinalis]SUW89490.1 IroE protein [Campylobacter hy
MKTFMLLLGAFLCINLLAKPSNEIPKISSKAYEIFEIHSPFYFENNSTRYKVFTAKTKRQTSELTVIYTLDGNAFFPTLLNLYADSFIDKASNLLIVAIGYDSDLAFDTLKRTKDYTPKVTKEEFSKGGNADIFLEFVKTSIIPSIEKSYNVSSPKRAIFGHSFGALFALNALLKSSNTFHYYFIASPSLWWGDGSFLPQNITLKSCPEIYITIGSLERQRGKTHTINAKNLADRIGLQSGCEVKFKMFENKTHGSVIPKAMSLMIDEVLDQDAKKGILNN